ncbi:MAG: septum formation protein Maf [Bradymonadales bacterium]|nr:septum formation protein Maf [Bradymonadales bacterium]
MIVPTPPIVLASRSPYRIELFRRLGLPFSAVAHRCDEEALKMDRSDLPLLASTLARLKAESLKERYPEALIVGSDQVAELDGEILGKPGDEQAAVAQLMRMRGRVHRLITALALVRPGPKGGVETAVDITRLKMRDLSDQEIRSYVHRDRPLDCAGSYRIERLGIALFESIETEDFTAIIGLPLLSLVSMLRELGIPVLDR